MGKVVENYNAGAISALSYMAELGATKEDVIEVAGLMDLDLVDIDEGDRERLKEAFGDSFTNIKSTTKSAK